MNGSGIGLNTWGLRTSFAFLLIATVPQPDAGAQEHRVVTVRNASNLVPLGGDTRSVTVKVEGWHFSAGEGGYEPGEFYGESCRLLRLLGHILEAGKRPEERQGILLKAVMFPQSPISPPAGAAGFRYAGYTRDEGTVEASLSLATLEDQLKYFLERYSGPPDKLFGQAEPRQMDFEVGPGESSSRQLGLAYKRSELEASRTAVLQAIELFQAKVEEARNLLKQTRQLR